MGLTEILGLTMTGGAGALVGVVGTVGTAILNVWKDGKKRDAAAKQREIDHRHERELRQVDLEVIKAETAAADKRHAHETAMTTATAASEVLAASYQAAARPLYTGKSALLKVAEFIRATARPFALYFLAIFVTAIFFSTENETIQIAIAQMVVFKTGLAFAWYFGGRQIEKYETNTAQSTK